MRFALEKLSEQDVDVERYSPTEEEGNYRITFAISVMYHKDVYN